MARGLCILVSLVVATAALLPCYPCDARRILPSAGVEEEARRLVTVREELLVEGSQVERSRELLASTLDYDLPDTNKNPAVGAPLYFNLPPPEPPRPLGPPAALSPSP